LQGETKIDSNDKILIACDHAGFHIKQVILELLNEKGLKFEDLGTYSDESVDYPDYGHEVARKISEGEFKRAILICGTGVGMSITANRYSGVRAALANDVYSARMSRLHNDANVLVIGGRVVGEALAEEIVTTWLNTNFEGGRHTRRIRKIDKESVETIVHHVVTRYLEKIEEVDRSALEKMVEESIEQILEKKNAR